ncbi:hypothetical protein PVAND_006468 [Polypedilum vanderplanki]|uniref:Spaetzle domain-containing protein n=1 Tax=Polypedilum vanderplanki TaxID=319348 RepID=A0A9J6C3A6_POLVA|nr:hypothetical protein PVAND_006468 [Polypedilum vanderplanki]
MKQFLSCCFLLSAVVLCKAIICNFTYEEDVKNYPEKLLNTILSEKKKINLRSKTHKSHEFDCEDENDDGFVDFGSFRAPGPFIKVNSFHLDSRFGNTASKEATPVSESTSTLDDDSHEPSESLCDAVKSTIYPKSLPNILNKMVIVVNHGKFKQEVTIEKCSDANQACKFSSNFPLGYVTKCKQKYQTHTLKVWNEHDQDIADDTIYLPSGCECQFKYKGNTKQK